MPHHHFLNFPSIKEFTQAINSFNPTLMELKDFYYCRVEPGKKRPIGQAWQKSPLNHESVEGLPAYGILSGRGGFLAIDCDGAGAIARLAELFGGEIPETWAWSSGKEGRIQFGFFVPEHLREKLKQARYWENLPDGSQLDFRWRGCQSVLPPSAHPETGAYIWVNDPEKFPLACAPEWLIDYAISLKNRNQDRVRIPARVYSFYGPSLKIWAYSQLVAKGSGRASFSLQKSADDLGRSISSIRRWLGKAEKKGLLRKFYTCDDWCVVYPTAMLKIVAATDLPELGEIAEVTDDFQKLRNLNILCTEAIACGLQKASVHAARKEIEQPPIEKAEVLDPFNPAEPGSRVLWGGQRFLAVSEKVAVTGISQKKVAVYRNVHSKTILRHLDTAYRSNVSTDLQPIDKVQILQRVPRRFNFLIPEIEPEIGKFLKCGDRFYKCCTNIYRLDKKLSLRLRCQRKAYKSLVKAEEQNQGM